MNEVSEEKDQEEEVKERTGAVRLEQNSGKELQLIYSGFHLMAADNRCNEDEPFY